MSWGRCSPDTYKPAALVNMSAASPQEGEGERAMSSRQALMLPRATASLADRHNTGLSSERTERLFEVNLCHPLNEKKM